MSKTLLWENTHFDKIIAVYDDGTEAEVGYIRENGERVYYAAASAPSRFRSDWNQQQYASYRARIDNTPTQSPSFQDLLRQQNRRVASGAGGLLGRLMEKQAGRSRAMERILQKALPYFSNNDELTKGGGLRLEGNPKAIQAYLDMLYEATGNHYEMRDGKTQYKASDPNFKGRKSQTLIQVINKLIASEEMYTLSIVGERRDDPDVFIDSYFDAKIDLSDLRKLGKASKALQGAAIGHFLNEIQVNKNYNTLYKVTDLEQKSEIFNRAHDPSLVVDGIIFRELVGDESIRRREEIPENVDEVEGTQTVLYYYNGNNIFQLKYFVKPTGEVIELNIGGTIFKRPAFAPKDGRLIYIRKIKK